MFNLEQSITEWRRQMLAAGIEMPALEELESHLRDEIEQQMKSGINAQQAFEAALGQIGRADILKNEFAKASIPIHERLRQIIFSVAQSPNYQLATNMNTDPPNLEPRWATYAKAGTFLFPAMFLWLFTVIFVLPKANEICQKAGTTIFNLDHAPAVFKASATIGQAMIFLTNHCLLTGGVIVLAFVLLERYFNRWPRYRRTAIGAGVFLFNAVVLASLTLMIIPIIVAVPGLVQHVKN
jgi:hypothetical protein